MEKFLLRHVENELADHIPGDDPRARRFRQDLARLNALAMTDRAMARALLKNSGDAVPRELVDLGAGDGTFMLRVAQRLAPRWRDVTVKLVDQQDIVSAQVRNSFAALHWNIQTITADVFEFLQDDAVERGYHHSKWFPASFHCRAFGSLAWPGGKKDEALCRLRAKANALCTRGEPLRLGLGLWRRDSP